MDGGKVRSIEEPALPPASRLPGGPAGDGRCCSPTAPSQPLARATRASRVRRAIRSAYATGAIDAATRSRYLRSYTAALRTRRVLGGQRRAQLAYVISTLERLAAARRLVPARMPALFLLLARNTEWWSRKGPPASGARIRFGSSRVIFQYYPGRGLQLQPLANFGMANGLWQGRHDAALRSLIDDLVALRVDRGSFTTWEYYFHFGGGSPPWISAMAQGTAMQALARASNRLQDERLLRIARSGRGAFERSTPGGVRVSTGGGAWYALYSFAPRLNVLNGMLQALIGLDTYVSYSGDAAARRLFAQGDRVARARIRDYDTGAWSLYSRPSGRAGPEADLNYHTLNRDFSRRLCRIVPDSVYCTAADNFTRYLKEDPRLTPHRAVPAPARAGRGVRFRFRLSKVGRVGITVRSETGRTYLSTSAPFSRGERWFRWVPPRRKREQRYGYRLFARDLAGNTAAASGSVRVKPAR